jgi:hypothetical protein
MAVKRKTTKKKINKNNYRDDTSYTTINKQSKRIYRLKKTTENNKFLDAVMKGAKKIFSPK